jgi:hypothetical protein
MGFMLDNLNFRNLAPAVQEQTLARIPLFSPPRAPTPSPVPSATPAPAGRPAPSAAGSVARLLAAF